MATCGGAEVETPGPQGKGTRIILSRHTQPANGGPGLTSNHCQIARRQWLRWAFASPVSGRHEFAVPVPGMPLAEKKPSPGGSPGEGPSSFDYYYFAYLHLFTDCIYLFHDNDRDGGVMPIATRCSGRNNRWVGSYGGHMCRRRRRRLRTRCATVQEHDAGQECE